MSVASSDRTPVKLKALSWPVSDKATWTTPVPSRKKKTRRSLLRASGRARLYFSESIVSLHWPEYPLMGVALSPRLRREKCGHRAEEQQYDNQRGAPRKLRHRAFSL